MLYRHLVTNKYSPIPNISQVGSAGAGWPTYKTYTNSTQYVSTPATSMDVNSKYIVVNVVGWTSGTSAQTYRIPEKKSWTFLYELNADGTLTTASIAGRTDIYTTDNNGSQRFISATGVSANPVNLDTFAISQKLGVQTLNVFYYYAIAGTLPPTDGIIVYKSGASWISLSSGVTWMEPPRWDNTGNYLAGITSEHAISLITWNGTAITNTSSISTSLAIRNCWWLGDRLIVAFANDGNTGNSLNSPALFSIYQRTGGTLTLLAERIILNTEGSFPNDFSYISNNRFFLAMENLASISSTIMLDVTYDGSTGLSASIVQGPANTANIGTGQSWVLTNPYSYVQAGYYFRKSCYPVGKNPSTGDSYVFTISRGRTTTSLVSVDTPAIHMGITPIMGSQIGFVDVKTHAPSKKVCICTDAGILIYKF